MRRITVIFAVCIALFALAYALGLRVNFTASAPRGLYILSSGAPMRGDMAAFCLDVWAGDWLPLARERGYLGSGFCPGGLQPLLKTLAAIPGDSIGMSSESIYVFTQNQEIQGGWPLARVLDSQGRPLPSSRLQAGTVPEGFALMLSEHEGSLDSRFFGLVPLASLCRVRPLIIF